MLIRYVKRVDPNKIFGMVGRCGGGYNTIWADWSIEGRRCREKIMEEFEQGMNKICGHYDRLEKSILKEGFRNPLIVTSGLPTSRPMYLIPPELRPPYSSDWLFLEGGTGGSRLWVAQKYNIPVPCIINDRVNAYKSHINIRNVRDAMRLYKDCPKLLLNMRDGIYEQVDTAHMVHLEEKWKEHVSIFNQRTPMWVDIMKKYGYSVHLTEVYKKTLIGE
jgi:hypothetical protein